MAGAATASRYRNLLEQHLAPLFTVIACRTRLPEKILWGNTARYLEVIFDQAQMLLEKRLMGTAHIAADRAALLHQSVSSGGRANPLYGSQNEATRLIDGSAVTVKLHRHCCLTYRLPGREYCGACPLAPSPTPSITQREPSNLTSE